MKMPLSKTKQPLKFDFILSLIILLLFVSSIVAIYSSFPLIPAHLVPETLLMNQIVFYLFGFAVIGVIMYLSNDNLFEFARIGYYIFMVLLAYLVLDVILQKVLGRQMSVLPFTLFVNGATSWLKFPLFGTLQPSEFMKVILIVICAYVIIQHNEEKMDDSFESDIHLFIKVGKWLVPPLILILLQPDTGLPIIIVASIGLMLICSGIRREWIIAAFAILIVILIIFFYLFYFNQPLFTKIFEPENNYRIQRIYGWLYPEEYSMNEGRQLYSALLAIGSSGISGHGLQSNVIPILEAQTDFIFAVIGLNFGFLGCVFIIGLCIALDIKILMISQRSKNNVEKIMLVGFLGMLVVQQVENIGMVIGFLPITGITLPLISSGGSSLLSYLMAFGIVMNASMRAKKLSDYVYK